MNRSDIWAEMIMFTFRTLNINITATQRRLVNELLHELGASVGPTDGHAVHWHRAMGVLAAIKLVHNGSKSGWNTLDTGTLAHKILDKLLEVDPNREVF